MLPFAQIDIDPETQIEIVQEASTPVLIALSVAAVLILVGIAAVGSIVLRVVFAAGFIILAVLAVSLIVGLDPGVNLDVFRDSVEKVREMEPQDINTG